MGLLTDPSAGQGRITKILLKYYRKICFFMYISGVAYFCSLAYPPMNLSTYFSENALLPGLARLEFRDDGTAARFHEELLDEMKRYEDSLPYPWITAKFRQIGLDSYTHNFTLNYPLGEAKKFRGKNVYGILRAARAASTEALVISVPYRATANANPTTAPSIAIMLAFAKFANKEKYWAKDIIFLVTEHEQLGIQAWLEAYHAVSCGDDGVLEHGELKGRAGAIQAAINLELHDTLTSQIDIKIEGLNGQLPNLDLFNLAAKMCEKENVYHTFKQRDIRSFRDPVKDWSYAFQTLMAMCATQATGIPNGNHGLFHRFGIEALTIEGFGTSNFRGARKVDFLIMGRIIEGIFRSLNNLLERLHQSFFFYLLPSTDRFVSIGLYMPAICLIAGALFIKACAKWCKLKQEQQEQEKAEESLKKEEEDPTKKLESEINPNEEFWSQMRKKFDDEIKRTNSVPIASDTESIDVAAILLTLFTTHFIGVLLMNSPNLLTKLGTQYGYKTDVSLFYGFVLISVLVLIVPAFILTKKNYRTVAAFHVISLLELGTAFISVSMNNISLAMFFSVIYVPFALLISYSTNGFHRLVQKVFWLLLHPMLVLMATVLVYTHLMFPGEKDNFNRGLIATQQALVFSVVDSMIYGNWLFSVVTSVFVPNWLCLWIVCFCNVNQPQINLNKKTN